MTMAPTSRLQAIAVTACAVLAVALVGGTVTDLGPWYQSLRQPDWKPPDFLFAPAWTVIYTLAGVAAYFSWRGAPSAAARGWVIALFALNGLLNILWSVVFFQLKRPDYAMLEVVLLWLSVLLLVVLMRRCSRVASWVLLPYLAWVTFAGVLNWAVVELNGPF